MADASEFHRPLLGGIQVTGAEIVQGCLVRKGSGTLTGLATRDSDKKKVLVTNLHVMTGVINIFEPSGNEEMYQETEVLDKKVGGQIAAWVEVVPGQNNIADIAMCELLDGVKSDFGIHSPGHGIRQVLAGVVEPAVEMELTLVGKVGGESIATVLEVDQTIPLANGYTVTGAVKLDTSQRPIFSGDSGAPCLVEDTPGRYRMSCIVFATQILDNLGWAFPASVAERELGITFGYQTEIATKITTRSEENMGIPILTSEGFVGQRWIVDDYFQAGETLYAGDVVGIKQDSSNRGSHPRVFKVTTPGEVRRIIGIVHTPAGQQVGDQVATTGTTADQDDYVDIVVQGVAQALSAVALEVGDPVTPSANSDYPPGKSHLVARVGAVTSTRDTYIGRCLSVTPGANQIADILVDIAGGYDSAIPAVTEPARTMFNVPTNLLVAATSTGGQLSVTWTAPSGFDSERDYYQYQYRENDNNAAWRPVPAAQTDSSSTRISGLPAIAHQVQVRMVYNDPQGTNEGVSDWVTATGTPLASPPPTISDATLSALGISPSSVSPVPDFDGATTAYTASAGNAVASVRVRPTVNQASATVTVNGVAVTSGQQSRPINLPVGVSTIWVVVTAQDGTTTKTYTMDVTRATLSPPPINRPPTANAGTDQTVNVGATVTLDGSGSSDPDSGDTLMYLWSQRSGTTVSLSNSTSARASFTAPSGAGTLVFRLTVSDGTRSVTDDVTIAVQQLLDFSALPGYGEPLDFLDSSYGSIHTLTDFNGAALNAVSAFTGVDTATQRGMFGIHGPLIPNVVGQSITDIPFFSIWVEEHTLTSSRGVVNWHKRLRIRIYNSSAIIPDWTVEGSGWDFVVEFQPVGGAWQEVLTDNNEDLLDAGFTSATRPMAFIQLQDSFLPQAEYDAFKSFFMADALSQYNIRIRVALD